MRFSLDRRADAKTAGGGRSGGDVSSQRLLAVTCRHDGSPGAIEVHVITDKCALGGEAETAKLTHFLGSL